MKAESKHAAIRIIIWSIALSTFLVSFLAFPYAPSRIATHWGVNGKPNGYQPKVTGLFAIPAFTFLLALLYEVIPRIDPKKSNILKFQFYYDILFLSFQLFLMLMNSSIVLWNFGYLINITSFVSILLGFLLIIMGYSIQNAKPNWFVGIRTPWTLSNNTVWRKTHKLGGKLFEISGLVSFFGAIFPNLAIWFVILPVIVSSVISVVYSYYIYQKLE